MLAGDGDDMRGLPLSMRKANLARLLARRSDGIFIAPFEQGEIGADLFRKACEFGLEGLVSKHRDRPCRGRTVAALDQGQEPELPRHDPSEGSRMVGHGAEDNAGRDAAIRGSRSG
jgi:hypothetical protein